MTRRGRVGRLLGFLGIGRRPGAAVPESVTPDEDRADWDRRWSTMPHRRVEAPPRFDLDPGFVRTYGPLVEATIALCPPEYADRSGPRPGRCPVCGERATPADRRPAHLSPTWANGTSLGFPAWVHPACFEALPDAGRPAPVPW